MPVLVALAVLAIPLIEIALFIEIGGAIGLGPTLAIVVLGVVIGIGALRHQGFDTAMRARRAIAAGAMPLVEMIDGLGLLVAGVCLITPGFFTDALGAVLLIPALRRAIVRLVLAHLALRVVNPKVSPTAYGDADIVDGEYVEIRSAAPPPKPPVRR